MNIILVMMNTTVYSLSHYLLYFQKVNWRKLSRLFIIRLLKRAKRSSAPFTVPQLAIVAHGTLKIYQLSSAGKEQLLHVIEPGGYAGEDALFGVVNENLYGETLQETKICFLRQQDFKNLLLKYPELSLKLLETTVRRAAEMRYQAQFLMMEDVESRIANYLLQLVKVVDSNSVMIPMKMKDLATFIGTTPETISRKFKILEEKGFIERRGRIIKILDIDSLEDDYA